MHEITLPEAKPAFEWVNGRALQKVSPKRKHSLAQSEFLIALADWAREGARGMAGTEWRFRIEPPGERRRPLVPDVAFLSYARLPYDEQQVTDEPRVAPDAVVEVLSPGDRRADIEEKVRVYLAAGTDVVFLVDPRRKNVSIRDRRGKRLAAGDALVEHESLPGFRLELSRLFALPRPR